MSGDHHPAPRRDRLSPWTASLLLYTGPVAWLVQIGVGEAMTSWPCFASAERRTIAMPGYGWMWIGAIAVLVLCALAASVAGWLAGNKFRDVREERKGGQDELVSVGCGRTRFVALWGIYLGLGFALATLVTLVAFILVPPCLG